MLSTGQKFWSGILFTQNRVKVSFCSDGTDNRMKFVTLVGGFTISSCARFFNQMQNGVQKREKPIQMVAQITNISLGRMRRQHYRLMLLYHIKNEKTCEGEEWELIWTRYEELQELFIERYPNSDEFEVNPEEFPNCKDTSIFSKEKINAKLRKIKFG